MTRTILIAEDDPAIAFGLKLDLQKEGYVAEIVTDGMEAVARASASAPDLLLLDVMMPKKDGFDVCRELRAAGCRFPIILLTALTQEAEVVMGLELGADDYITKPFSPRVLRARIKAALRRTDEPEAPSHKFGALEVDFDRGEVRRDGEPAPLTALEYKLLSAFVRNRGRLLSRSQLLDLVWGPGTFVTDRVVDNHVVALRRKIEANPTEPEYILNVRGLGYRFDV